MADSGTTQTAALDVGLSRRLALYDELVRAHPKAPEGAAPHVAIPDGWTTIPLEERLSKEKITLRIDTDVLDFFRTTGTGWQTRLNAVLRLFMQHRQS